MVQIIAFLLLVVILGFVFFFMHTGKINNVSFTTITILTLILFVAFYSLDRLKELNLKDMKIVLTEMKTTKSQFDEDVNLILNLLSDSVIDSAVHDYYLMIDPNFKNRLQKRDAVCRLLKSAGKTENEIEEKLSVVDSQILGDIAYDITDMMTKKYRKINKLKTYDRDKVVDQLKSLRRQVCNSPPTAETIDTFNKSLTELDIDMTEPSKLIDVMYYFVKNKKIDQR